MSAELQGEIAAATFKALSKLDRAPFRRALATFLGCQPSEEKIKEFAADHPDRWAQAVSVLGGLAGFERGLGPTINLYDFSKMSDAQLEGRLAELERLAAAKDVTPPNPSTMGIIEAGDMLPPGAEPPPLACPEDTAAGASHPVEYNDFIIPAAVSPSTIVKPKLSEPWGPQTTDAPQSAAIEIPTFITLKSKGF